MSEDAEVTRQPGEGMTAFSVRRIQYDAWQEGHLSLCRRHGVASFEVCRNPYADPTPAHPGGDQ